MAHPATERRLQKERDLLASIGRYSSAVILKRAGEVNAPYVNRVYEEVKLRIQYLVEAAHDEMEEQEPESIDDVQERGRAALAEAAMRRRDG